MAEKRINKRQLAKKLGWTEKRLKELLNGNLTVTTIADAFYALNEKPIIQTETFESLDEC